MNPQIKKILEAGIRAPSGDNCQPWKLAAGDNQIEIYNDLGADNSLYNFQQAASHLALGALIENMLIASRALGHAANLRLFPDGPGKERVAAIKLEPAELQIEPLYAQIEKRANNRKPFSDAPLTEGEKKVIFEEAKKITLAELRLVDQPEMKDSLAAAVSKNEKLVLENRQLHHYLFAHVNWTAEEARQKGRGMYLKTLEMPAPAELIFKICSKWTAMKILAKIGLPDLIARQNQQIYRQAGAYGAIIIEDNAPEKFVQTGRLLERVWLTAGKLGLAFNAMAGVAFLHHRTACGGGQNFNPQERELINNAYADIKSAFNIDSGIISFVFRVGKAEPPGAFSYRLPLEKVMIFK